MHVEFGDIRNRDDIPMDNCDVDPRPPQSIPKGTVEGVPPPGRVGGRRPILIGGIEDGVQKISDLPININTDEESNVDGAESHSGREGAASVGGTRDMIFESDQIPASGPSLTACDAEDETGLPKVGMGGVDLTIGPNGGCGENIDDLDSLLRGFSQWVFFS